MKTSEVAKLLNVSTRTVLEWEKNGWISKPFVINNQRNYSSDDVDIILCSVYFSERAYIINKGNRKNNAWHDALQRVKTNK